MERAQARTAAQLDRADLARNLAAAGLGNRSGGRAAQAWTRYRDAPDGGKIIGALLVIYAAVSYHMVLGIPGVPYPPSFSQAIGWPVATRELKWCMTGSRGRPALRR